MRGFRVKWSPDDLVDEGVRSRPYARNPGAVKLYKYLELIASGKPARNLVSSYINYVLFLSASQFSDVHFH
jgi:hypothetical protein